MEVSVELWDKNGLWPQFHSHRNEMIVTKWGRKLFPELEFSIKGLEPQKFYGISLHLRQVDDNRYEYRSGQWFPVRGREVFVSNSVFHSSGPRTGKEWMESEVHFERMKITNNCQQIASNRIFIDTFHKYVPVLTIFEMQFGVGTYCQDPVKVATFEETEFIAVTTYQNEKIKNLKVQWNPFAKSFRAENIENRKRKKDSNSPVEEKKKKQRKENEPNGGLQPTFPFHEIPNLFWNPYFFMNTLNSAGNFFNCQQVPFELNGNDQMAPFGFNNGTQPM